MDMNQLILTKQFLMMSYLHKAFENVLRWEESDKELAQGRTNFQLEKFALLETHTLPVAFENTLKSRRQMAEGYMYKTH